MIPARTRSPTTTTGMTTAIAVLPPVERPLLFSAFSVEKPGKLPFVPVDVGGDPSVLDEPDGPTTEVIVTMTGVGVSLELVGSGVIIDVIICVDGSRGGAVTTEEGVFGSLEDGGGAEEGGGGLDDGAGLEDGGSDTGGGLDSGGADGVVPFPDMATVEDRCEVVRQEC